MSVSTRPVSGKHFRSFHRSALICRDFLLKPELLRAISDLGFEHPSEVIDRKKGYFPVPGLKHLEGATLGWVRDLLVDPAHDRGIFNPQMLDRLLTDPQGQLTPLRGSKLWQMAALNLWLSEQGL